VFEIKVLRGIFGPKREDVAIGWRELHSEELHNLSSSPNIIRVTTSRNMKWPKQVASLGSLCINKFCIYLTAVMRLLNKWTD
jgi:hypothetical protein